MSDFSAVLNDMRDHFKKNIKSGKATRYSPSPKVANFFAGASTGASNEADGASFLIADDSASLSPEIQARLDDVETHAKILAKEESSYIEDKIGNETQGLIKSGNSKSSTDRFKAKLAKLREDTKARSAESIDRIYDAAEKIGENFPESQSTIYFVLEKVSNLFHDLKDKILDFIFGIVNDVAKWVAGAWKTVTATFNGIKTWISHWF